MTDEYPTDASQADAIRRVTAAGASVVPWVGGLLGELILEVWPSQLELRRVSWFEELAEKIATVAEDVDELREKLESDHILEMVIKAGTAAQTTASDDKRSWLASVVVNSLRNIDTRESVELMFLSLVDRFTPLHMRTLMTLADLRSRWEAETGRSAESVSSSPMNALVEVMKVDKTLLELITQDLTSSGLIRGSLTGMRTKQASFDGGVFRLRTRVPPVRHVGREPMTAAMVRND